MRIYVLNSLSSLQPIWIPTFWKIALGKHIQLFTHPEVAPIVTLSDQWKVLELFHGPTLAFKDFALQLLGNFYEAQIERDGEAINYSRSDFGRYGCCCYFRIGWEKGRESIYSVSKWKISPLQERQMTCTGASNVYPIAIEGTFDDAKKP